MTTRICDVCGSDTHDTSLTICPVCGADLPAPISATDDAPEPTVVGDDATTDLSDSETSEDEIASAGWPAVPPPPSGVTPPPPPVGTTPPPAGWTQPAAAPAAYAPNSPYDPTHPSGLSSSVRTWGTLTHLSAFVGAAVALAFVGPLVMWLIKREEHPFLDHHGKEALNFNLSMLLYAVVGVVISILTLGFGLIVAIPLGIALFVTWVVAPIIGAVKASNGEGYRYPVTIRFIAD
jgi:uncharacterized protein